MKNLPVYRFDRDARSCFPIISLIVCVLFANSACQQLFRTATKPGEVSINIEFLGQKGTSSSYHLPLEHITNHRNIPNNYKLLPNGTYEVTTTALEYGQTIITFKPPVSTPEQFKKLRILILVPAIADLDPNGFEWRDCTIITGHGLDGNHDDELTPRQSKFVPDPENGRISCAVTDRFGPNNYFAVAYIQQEPPVIPNEITAEIIRTERTDENGQTVYTLLLTNSGNRDLEEVDFHSNFDSDTRIVSFEPEHGLCKKSSWGFNLGAVACYVGPLAKGEHVLIKLVGETDGLDPDKKPNENWIISGRAKAKADDYAGSYFRLKPLRQN